MICFVANIRRICRSRHGNRAAPLRSREAEADDAADCRPGQGGGAEALTEAVRRADEARYQEVRCRSALNRVKGMPFEWTLNPYRGCTHGCHYCYARRYHTQFELGADDEFASIIFVKTNFVDVLRRELQRPSWAGEYVAVGTATDCYQPIEGHYKLTRRALEALERVQQPGRCDHQGSDDRARQGRARGPHRGPGLQRVHQRSHRGRGRLAPAGARHGLSTAASSRRARAGGRRRPRGRADESDRAGHHVEAGAARAHVKAIADHGARFVGCNVMFLEGGTRDHFMRWLAQEFPGLVEGTRSSMPRKYAPSRPIARRYRTSSECCERSMA